LWGQPIRVLRGGSWNNNINNNVGARLVLARAGMIYRHLASKLAHASAMTSAAPV